MRLDARARQHVQMVVAEGDADRAAQRLHDALEAEQAAAVVALEDGHVGRAEVDHRHPIVAGRDAAGIAAHAALALRGNAPEDRAGGVEHHQLVGRGVRGGEHERAVGRAFRGGRGRGAKQQDGRRGGREDSLKHRCLSWRWMSAHPGGIHAPRPAWPRPPFVARAYGLLRESIGFTYERPRPGRSPPRGKPYSKAATITCAGASRPGRPASPPPRWSRPGRWRTAPRRRR